MYSSYLGGSNNDIPSQVVVDAEGQAVVVGWTSSRDFPTFNPLQGSMNGAIDAFVTKIAVSGSSLIYSTYLGGSDTESASSVTDDGASGVWVAGGTYSTDFPLLNPFQPAYGGGYEDGFLTHIAPSANDPAAVTCSACETPRAH